MAQLRHQRLTAAFASATLFALVASQALAEEFRRESPWSVSIYGGPYSDKYFGAVLQDANLQSHKLFVAVTLDRKLINFGSDVFLVGELQVTQIFNGHADTIFDANVGLQLDRLFGYDHTSLTLYSGPSYALDPDYVSIGYKHRMYSSWRKKFLNGISLEFASNLPGSTQWDWVARFYHRSGMFGVYSQGDDDGLGFGLGLKHHF